MSVVWQPGEVVVVRYGSFGALPLTVIEHSAKQLVAHLAEGTEIAAPILADGRGLREVPLEERWAHPRRSVLRPWRRSDLVMIFPRDRRHSLWVFREGGEHVGWYVNLEEPHVYGERSISTRDGILDIWVPVDSGEPEWKDEDEFAMAIEVGRLSAGEAAALRREGELVIEERPWPTGWETWRPPQDWARPRLPPDWAESA